MATLLWLAVGVLLALVAWLLPAGLTLVSLIMLVLTLIANLLPRDVTAAGAKAGIGYGAFYAVLFGRLLFPDPLQASGETYLVVIGGVLILMLGVMAVVRNRRHQKRQARIKAAEAVLS
jgi:Na+/proline symporter